MKYLQSSVSLGPLTVYKPETKVYIYIIIGENMSSKSTKLHTFQTLVPDSCLLCPSIKHVTYFIIYQVKRVTTIELR